MPLYTGTESIWLLSLDTSTPLQFVKGIGPARARDARNQGTPDGGGSAGLRSLPLRRSKQREDHRAACAGRNGDGARRGAVRAPVGLPAPQSGDVRGDFHGFVGRTAARANGFTAGIWRIASRPGCSVALFGKVEFDSYTGDLLHDASGVRDSAERRSEGDAALHTGRIVPIYEAAGKITTRVFRMLLHRISIVAPLEDHLPERSARIVETAGPLDRASANCISRRRTPICGC